VSVLDGGPFELSVGDVRVVGDRNQYGVRVVMIELRGQKHVLRADVARSVGIALQAVAVCAEQARER
jgi:hypothetical protein